LPSFLKNSRLGVQLRSGLKQQVLNCGVEIVARHQAAFRGDQHQIRGRLIVGQIGNTLRDDEFDRARSYQSGSQRAIAAH
jgi:hypothetical protein